MRSHEGRPVTSSNLWDLDYGTDSSGAFGTIRRLAQQAVKVAQPITPAYDPWQEEATSIYSDQPQVPMPQAESYAQLYTPEPSFFEPVAPPVQDYQQTNVPQGQTWQVPDAPQAPIAPEFPFADAPVPQGGHNPFTAGFESRWNDFRNFVAPAFETIDPLQNIAQEAGDVAATAFQFGTPGTPTGPGRPVDTPFSQAAEFAVENTIPQTPFDIALTLAPGIGELDDVYRAGGAAFRGAGRFGANYADNLARMGAEAVPTGAVDQIIAPAANLGKPERISNIPEPVWTSADGEVRHYQVGDHLVQIDQHSPSTFYVSTERAGAAVPTPEDPMGLNAFIQRSPGGSVSGLRDVAELIRNFADENPVARIMADPTDARRSRVYQMFGFKELPNGLLELDRGGLEAGLRSRSPVPGEATGQELVNAPIRGISPTEGYDIAPMAGGMAAKDKLTPEQLAEMQRLSDEITRTMGSPAPDPNDVFMGEAPIGGGPENWVRQAEPPPPVEPPLNLGGGDAPVPGGAANAGRLISFTDTNFAPTQPLLDSPGPLFDTPPVEGMIPAGAPLPPDVAAQRTLDNTRNIVKGLPEDAQPQVMDFITAANQQLAARPDTTNLARRVTAPISGNLQSPFVDELANQEGNLRQLITPSITKSELDPETAMERVRDTQLAFRKQALDDRYGPTPTEARKRAEETLKEGDRRRMVSGATGKVYDAVSDVLKQTVLGLDVVSAVGQQGLRAGRGSPSIVLGIINRAIEKMGMDTGIWQGDHLAQMLADGVPTGRGAAGLNPDSIYARIPKVGPAIENITTAQFQGLDKVGALSYEGQMLINKVLHDIPILGKFLGGDILDPQVRRNIARHAATVRSSAMSPTGARRSGIERRGLLSGPMTRAQINEALTFFQDPTRPENRLAALNLIGGTAIIAAAGKEIHDQLGAEGSTYDTDPFSPDFGVITTKFKNKDGLNIKISVMPQTSIPKGVLLAAGEAVSGDPQGALEAITRTSVGRTNVLPADILRLAPQIGYDNKGFNIDLPSSDALKASIPAPLSLQKQIIEGDFTAPSLIASQTGLTNYEESNYEAFDRQFQRLTGFKPNDLLAGEVYDRTRGTPELQAAYDQWQQGRDSESADIMREKLNGLTEAAPLLKTEPQQYRESVANVTERARIRYEQAKKDGKIPEFDDPKGIRKAYDEFFEAIAPAKADGKVDYDLQERLSADYLAGLDNGTRERILKELTFSPDPSYRELLETRQKAKEYFGLIEETWQDAVKDDPELAKFGSPNDFVRDQQLQLMESAGLERDMARDIARSIADAYMGAGRANQITYLLDHEELLPSLYKFDYYIPPAVKPLATLPR